MYQIIGDEMGGINSLTWQWHRNIKVYYKKGRDTRRESQKNELWKKRNETESESQIAQKERESNVCFNYFFHSPKFKPF